MTIGIHDPDIQQDSAITIRGDPHIISDTLLGALIHFMVPIGIMILSFTIPGMGITVTSHFPTTDLITPVIVSITLMGTIHTINQQSTMFRIHPRIHKQETPGTFEQEM